MFKFVNEMSVDFNDDIYTLYSLFLMMHIKGGAFSELVKVKISLTWDPINDSARFVYWILGLNKGFYSIPSLSLYILGLTNPCLTLIQP